MNKKQQQKELAKYEMNVLSPRSYNYIKLKTKDGEGTVEIKPHISVKGEALFDVVFDKFAKQNDFKALKELPSCKAISTWSSNTFDDVVEDRNNEKPPKFKCIIELSSKEIRKTLGLSRFTDKQIFKEAEKLELVLIKAEGMKIWNDGSAGYETTVTWLGHLIRSVEREKTDRIAPRTKSIQYRFRFVLEDATVMLWSNDALFRRMSLFQTRYYSLPYGCQRLLRYLSLWAKSHLNLKQVADILDWKSIPNTARKIKQVEKILERLKEEGYITGWNRVKKTRGLKTLWFIWGIDTIRQQPKVLKEAEVIETKNTEEAIGKDNIIEAELVIPLLA